MILLGLRGGLEAGELLGTEFAGGEDRPQHRQHQSGAAEPEGEAHRVGDAAARRDVCDADALQRPGNDRAHHRAGADEGGLHGVAGAVLVLAEHVADEGAERLHRDVQRRVQHPQHQRGDEKGRRFGHGEKGEAGEDRARQEVRAAAAEAAEPGAVAHMADDRLDEEAGERRRHPQSREVIDRGAERLEDAAHVRVLEGEPDLDAEEAERDVPQLGEPELRLARRVYGHGQRHPPSPPWCAGRRTKKRDGGAVPFLILCGLPL